VPGQLAKAAGAPARLTARVDAAGGGRLRFEAALDLAGVDLRPGAAVAKGPGDPLSLTARGSARVGKGTEVTLEEVALTLLGDRLTGRGSASLGAAGPGATRFELAASGERLDLDRLLLPTPPDAPARPPTAWRRESFAGLAGTAELRLAALRVEGAEMRDVVLRLRVEEDRMTLEECRLAAFGGTVSAAGSSVALAQPGPPVTARLDLAGVAGKEVLALLSRRDVLDGRVDATVQLTGQGLGGAPLVKSLAGSIGGRLSGGVFKGKDLVAGVAGPLASRLPFTSKALTDEGGTPLGKELPFALTVADGRARLARPLAIDAGRGQLEVTGAVGLDGTLDLPGTLSLSPETVARLTLGKVRLAAPLPIAFTLAGPAWKPRLEKLGLDGAVKALAAQAAAGALGKAAGVDAAAAEEKARAARAEAEASAAAAAAEAKARVEAERQRLAEEAKKAEADAKRRLEEEAARRLKGLFGK
jgi:AsmA protein